MLNAPRLSLVPLGAEHFEPLAAMYADREIMRFLEPAPLDRGEPGGGSPCTSVTGRCAATQLRDVRSQRVAERGGAKVEREMVLRGSSGATFSLAATLTFPVVALEEFG